MKLKFIIGLFFVLTQMSISLEQTLLQNYNFVSSTFKIKNDKEFYALLSDGIYFSENQGKDWKPFFKVIDNNLRNYFVYKKSINGSIRHYIFLVSIVNGISKNETYLSNDNGQTWDEYFIQIEGIIENKATFDEIVNSNLIISSNYTGFLDEDKYGNLYFRIAGGNYLFKLSEDGTKGILQNTGISSFNYSLIGSFNENNFLLSENKIYTSNNKSNDWIQLSDSIKTDNLDYIKQFDDNFLFYRDSSYYNKDTKIEDKFVKFYKYNINLNKFTEILELKSNVNNGSQLKVLGYNNENLLIFSNQVSAIRKSIFLSINTNSKQIDTLSEIKQRISEIVNLNQEIFVISNRLLFKIDDWNNNNINSKIINCNKSFAFPYYSLYTGNSTWYTGFQDFEQFVVLDKNTNFYNPLNFTIGRDYPFQKLDKIKENLLALVNSRCSMYSQDNGLNWDSIKFEDNIEPNISDFIEMENSLIGINGKNYLSISNDNGESWKKYLELDNEIYFITKGRNYDIFVSTIDNLVKINPNFEVSEIYKYSNDDIPLRIIYNEKNNILINYGYLPDDTIAYINKSTDYGNTWTKFVLEMGREIPTFTKTIEETPPFNLTLDNNGNFYIIDIDKMYILHKDRFTLDTFQITDKLVTFIDYNYYNDTDKGVILGASDGIYLLDYVNSINEKGEIKLNLLTYPNPSSDYIKIDIDNINSAFAIDLNGAKIKLNFEKNNIDISSLVKGIYQLIIEDISGKISISKFIKE